METTERPEMPGAGKQGVPRWPGVSVLLIIGGIYLLVSSRYALGPSWLLLAVIVVLLIPITISRARGRHQLTRQFALLAVGIVTVAIVASAGFLVLGLVARTSARAPALLRDAALIWIANILTFALWYWEIDAGGPAQRHHGRYACIDFVFPQMTISGPVAQHWKPGFVDYLFLAFNTSTALSPTDTLVLSRRAKLLMMLQALISLVVIAVLAARAINTLPTS